MRWLKKLCIAEGRLLKATRPFVSDAQGDEDPDAAREARALLD